VSLRAFVKPNLYKDSVALMRIADDVQAASGATRITLLMGTPANKEILVEGGLMRDELTGAGPADLIVIIEAADDTTGAAAGLAIESRLDAAAPAASGEAQAAMPVRAIASALDGGAPPRVAQISVPGAYAGAEAMKALKAGMHVFLFSDNVPVEHEVAIKRLAQSKGLLVMGPDCGTAIIDGVPLGFANVVRRGPIGLVAASGTGLQEVTVQIHHLGGGVSHAIGTGGRDVSAAVGGRSMLAGIDALAADAATSVIVIVSKPPAPEVTPVVIERLRAAGKPAVVLFLGAAVSGGGNIHPATTLLDAAQKAVALAGAEPAATAAKPGAGTTGRAPTQRYLRALFSGGTYCTEAQVIWRDAGVVTHSNVPLDKSRALADPRSSVAHTAVDLGEDFFTVGKPHPMIDPATRIARIAAESADPETAVLLLDVVLGYGSHDDPAGALAPAIRGAQAAARAAGRTLPVVAFVCGTEEDPQRRSRQEATLVAAGAIVASSSTDAARLALTLAVGPDRGA